MALDVGKYHSISHTRKLCYRRENRAMPL